MKWETNIRLQGIMKEDFETSFLIQDGFIGDTICWWRRQGKGYTGDVTDAHIFTQAEAIRLVRENNKRVMWPLALAMNNITLTVNNELINKKDQSQLREVNSL